LIDTLNTIASAQRTLVAITKDLKGLFCGTTPDSENKTIEHIIVQAESLFDVLNACKLDMVYYVYQKHCGRWKKILVYENNKWREV